MLQQQPFEISDFSGGMTDNYLAGPLNKYQMADNLLITSNRKLQTAPGSTFYDTSNPRIPVTGARIAGLINFNRDSFLLIQAEKDLYYLASGVKTKLVGPSSNSVFSAGDATSHCAWSEWNGHLFMTNDAFSKPVKVFRDAGGTLRVRTAGLPVLASAPTVTAGAAGGNAYIYAFLYFYEYTVDNKTFNDFGATTQVQLASAAAPNSNAVAVSNIPVLANGSTGNYDTASIKVKIYRTIAGGTTLYYVGEVTNGTTTYSDSTSDATLILSSPIYTEGDVPDNEAPPLCKYVHIVGGKAFWAHVKEGSEVMSYRILQSIPDDPDSVPSDFYVDVEDEITGISSVSGTPIVLCRRSVYRLDGSYDELGRGTIVPQKISSGAGCVSHNSIVQTLRGIFFAGYDGFYFCDGYQVLKISEDINTTYKSLVTTETQQKNIYGVLDSEGVRVWWGSQTDAGSGDNDKCFVLDLRWGIKPNSSFTTRSGGESFRPSALVFFSKEMIRGDSRGYLFKHDDDLLTDPKYDAIIDPSEWLTQTIIHDFRSCSYDFGTTLLRKWVPKIIISCGNTTNLSIQVGSANDDSRYFHDLIPIRYRGNMTWGDADLVWGEQDLTWNFEVMIEEQRRFPAGTLRCSYKQIRVTNGHVIINKSDVLGKATVNAGTLTATLDDAGSAWPTDCVDYTISFENDNYTREFAIVQRTATMITVSDPDTQLPSGSQKWVIRGKPKGEVLLLLSFNIPFTPISQTQPSYKGRTGGNA